MNIQSWIAHFEANRHNRAEPDWCATLSMPDGKRAALARSLAEYQLGDGGGECKLVAHDAEAFRSSGEDMDRLVDLWFAEEREHSRLLSHAVKRVAGTPVTDSFAMRLFYGCRRALGVDFELLVLLVVEIVSTGYYRVIRKYVGDDPIAAMCQLILRDEARHIDFHRDRLTAGMPAGPSLPWSLKFRLLGEACAWFLWIGKNGHCLRTLGCPRGELFHHVRSGLANLLAEVTAATGRELASGTAASDGGLSSRGHPVH
jgi:hypothetical protein